MAQGRPSALVMAASKGLGRASAKHILKNGATVTISSRSTDNLQATKKHLLEETDAAPNHVRTVRCDLSEPSEIREAVETTVSETGRLDMLVTNGPADVQPKNTKDISTMVINNINFFILSPISFLYLSDNLRHHTFKTVILV